MNTLHGHEWRYVRKGDGVIMDSPTTPILSASMQPIGTPTEGGRTFRQMLKSLWLCVFNQTRPIKTDVQVGRKYWK